jgi:hypothetical protein
MRLEACRNLTSRTNADVSTVTEIEAASSPEPASNHAPGKTMAGSDIVLRLQLDLPRPRLDSDYEIPRRFDRWPAAFAADDSAMLCYAVTQTQALSKSSDSHIRLHLPLRSNSEPVDTGVQENAYGRRIPRTPLWGIVLQYPKASGPWSGK